MSKKLVIYLMAGAETPALAAAAVAGGADIIEFGIPFSDPLADGPVIRAAGEKALAAGMRTAACLECLAETRALVGDTPLVPMTGLLPGARCQSCRNVRVLVEVIRSSTTIQSSFRE